MDKIQLAQALKSLIKERFPGNYNYTPLLAEILGIHEKTVLSKLRGATQFTVEELYKIAAQWDISVGDIFNKSDSSEKHPMEIYIHDFSILRENQQVVTKTLEAFRLASTSEHSTYYVASNTLPDLVFARHEWIAKFTYAKWLYFNRGRDKTIGISDIQFTPEDNKAHKEYLECIHAFKRSVYILHSNMMQFIAEDILFFYQIRLITKEEAYVVIEDYYKVLDEFEDICNGRVHFPNNKEINVFFSNILLTNDITVIESDELNLAIIYAYFHNPIVTTKMSTFHIIRKWFYSWLNSANIISVSDPVRRYEFFHKQREYLAELKEKLE